MKLSEYIKEFRISRNLTQVEFAKQADLTQTQISLLESDNLSVGYLLVKKLSRAMNISVEKVREMLDEK